MEISYDTINSFEKIFAGNPNAYGVFTREKITEKGKKVEGKAKTVVQPVMSSLYEDHLQGASGLGIIPVREDGTCNFAVIDIDKYDNTTNTIIKAVYKHNLPLVPFRSKSGGLHLYLFLDAPIQVKQVLKVMIYFRRLFGLKNNTEIFPKQTMLQEGEVGNWINLPYYNAVDTTQYAIGMSLEKLDLIDAINLITDKKVARSDFDKITENTPLNDAPPCLQSIYTLGTTHDRNLYLFSLARYFKAKEGDNFEYFVAQANNELENPIPIDELSNTVIKAHKKKSYSYKCREEPICSLCDKAECKLRKYGIGGEEVSDISYEDFIQYGTDEPYYDWIINGQALTFTSEADIINQIRFRELCFRKIHILPHKLSDFNWTEIINTALHNVIIKDEEDKAGMAITPSQLFKEHLAEFLTKRALASAKEHIIIDRVYKDDDEKCYIFKSKNLITFLQHQKQFRVYGLQQISAKLKEMGGFPVQYLIESKGVRVRVWKMPFDSVRQYIDESPKDVEIDFLDQIPEKDY